MAELIDWVASVRTGRPFAGASAWDGLVTMIVTQACIRSLECGEDVSVVLPEKPALYR